MKHKPAPIQGAGCCARVCRTIRSLARPIGLVFVLLAAPSVTLAQVLVSVVASDDSASETPADNGEFVVLRSGGDPAQSVTINYSVTGTATPGADYTALSGSVSLEAGESAVSIVVDVPGDDGVFEGNETVTISLLEEDDDGDDDDDDDDDNGGVIVVVGTATVTILDNPQTVTAASSSNASENPVSNGQITVSLGGRNESGNALNVNYSVAGTATPTIDYVALSGVAVIPVGSSSTSIDVTPLDDDLPEDLETVDITLTATSDPSVSIGTPASASLSIADDDEDEDNGDEVLLSIFASDDSASETSADNGEFVIRRVGGDPERPVKLDYSITGSASNGDDYAPLSGKVNLEANQSEIAIAVNVAGDDGVFEGDETVTITLRGKKKEVIVEPGSATVTILDSAYSVTASSSANASENPVSNGQISISLGARNESSAALTVEYSVAGTATAGSDYEALSGAAVVPIGSSSASIDVTPLDDDIQEALETVEITLTATSDPSVSIGTPATAGLSIADDGEEDDDVRLSVFAADDSASETPADNGEFVVRRVGGNPERPVTINYSVGGSASSGVDYAPLAGTVSLGANEPEVGIAVNVPGDDGVFEGDETVNVALGAADDVVVEVGSATVTIRDSAYSVTASNSANASENPASDGQISISLGARNDSDAALTVEYSVAGTATPGTDYEALSGAAVIAIGSSSTSIDVTPLDDDLLEADEAIDITLTATNDPGVSIGTPATASVSIADDDSAGDDDGDGLSNAEECPDAGQCPDTDQDALTNDHDPDDDDDGIPTASENAPGQDTDADGNADYLENDDDGDGRLTRDEDTNPDGDGNPSTNPTDLDGDSVPDYLDVDDRGGPEGDADSDGLTNEREEELGTDPEVADTDGDGVNDGDEVAAGTDPLDQLSFADADGDLVPDATEAADGTDPNDPVSFADGDGGGTADHIETITYAAYGIAPTNVADASDDRRDLDSDGLPDRLEISFGSDPNAEDSPTLNGAGDDNGNGISNAVDAYLATLGIVAVDAVSDRDRDGYPDVAEVALGLNPLRASENDSDSDGVPDVVEIRAGIDIDGATDSDGDGVPDAREIALGADALDANSPVVNGALDDDGDGVSNAIEQVLQTLGASDDVDASGDGDADGIGDADEIRFGTDPFRDEQPALWIELAQADIGPVSALLADGGMATATALVGGHQTGTLLYDWTESDNAVLAVSIGGQSNETLAVAPQTLPPGPYNLVLSVQRMVGDYSSPVSTVEFTISVLVSGAAAQVADADNDGVPDASDDADAASGFANELQAQSGARMQADTGVRLQLGTTARIAGTGSARVTRADIAGVGDGNGGTVGNSEDEFDYLGGIYDFEVTNLPEVGSTVQIVIPQGMAIGEFPEYRKFQPGPGWVNFVEDANNSIASAASGSGACPAPGDDSYQSGLTPGHFCIQLSIEDGGPNDGDAAFGPNGVIKDPGGVATPKGEVVAGQGGGSLSPVALVVLCLVVLIALLRRRRGRTSQASKDYIQPSSLIAQGAFQTFTIFSILLSAFIVSA